MVARARTHRPADHPPCTVHVDVNRGTAQSGHALSRRVDTLHRHVGIPEAIASEAVGDDASFGHAISSLSFIGACSPVGNPLIVAVRSPQRERSQLSEY